MASALRVTVPHAVEVMTAKGRQRRVDGLHGVGMGVGFGEAVADMERADIAVRRPSSGSQKISAKD